MTDLKPCHCGGSVSHLIRDEEESIIKCDKCGEVTDIEQLWNAQSNKHSLPQFSDKFVKELKEKLDFTEGAHWTQNTVGYCPDCGVSRIPPFLKRCSRCCDTEEKQTEQAEACERNKEFYGQSPMT